MSPSVLPLPCFRPLDGWCLAQDGSHPIPTFTPFYPQPASPVMQGSPLPALPAVVMTTTTTSTTNVQYVGGLAVVAPAIPMGVPIEGWANEAPNLRSICTMLERELTVVREACAQLSVPEDADRARSKMLRGTFSTFSSLDSRTS